MFPVDFFEHCSVMTSVEFGGNDLLQIYNVQQLKNRLNGQGKFGPGKTKFIVWINPVNKFR